MNGYIHPQIDYIYGKKRGGVLKSYLKFKIIILKSGKCKKRMIGTEFLKGQGLGNQLFCYVTARCIAIDNNVEFGTASQENFANNIHSNKGMYFMNVDLGREIDKEKCSKIVEREERLITPTSKHNMTLGVYVAGSDKRLLQKIEDNTLIYGNLQAEEYFIKHKDEIKEWLKVNKEYFRPQYSDNNLCILKHARG